MSLGEPMITVFCDRNTSEDCERKIECSLTELAGGSWDARDVEHELKRYGWITFGREHICIECKHEEGE